MNEIASPATGGIAMTTPLSVVAPPLVIARSPAKRDDAAIPLSLRLPLVIARSPEYSGDAAIPPLCRYEEWSDAAIPL